MEIVSKNEEKQLPILMLTENNLIFDLSWLDEEIPSTNNTAKKKWRRWSLQSFPYSLKYVEHSGIYSIYDSIRNIFFLLLL